MNDSLSASKTKVKRPISAWILLILLVPTSLVGFSQVFISTSIFKLIYSFVLGALAAFAAWGIIKRRSYGRWLGLIFIFLVFLTGVMSLLKPGYSTSRPDVLRPSSPGQEAGAYFASLAKLPLSLVWFYFFGFSQKSKKYFR